MSKDSNSGSSEDSGFVNYIGRFHTLTADKFKTDLSKAYYIAGVKHKDRLVDNCNFDPGENPYYMFETFEQIINPPEKGTPKPTYRTTKTIKDKDTGLTAVDEVSVPMRKFYSVSSEAKSFLTYMLCSFIREAQQYYRKNKCNFPEDDVMLRELSKYSINHLNNPVLPFMVECTQLFDVDLYFKGGYNSIEKKLTDKIEPYFKDSEERIPSAKIRILVDCYVRFMHIISLKTSNFLFPARKSVNTNLILGFIYDLNTMVKKRTFDPSLSQDTINVIQEYMEAFKKSKAKKGDDDDSDEDKPKPKRKPPAKGKGKAAPKGKAAAAKEKAAPKKRGRPKKEVEEEPEEEDEDQEIEDAVDELGNENDWEEDDTY
jgi:hypothetical protein